MVFRVIEALIGVALAAGGGYLAWINRGSVDGMFPPEPGLSVWTFVGGLIALIVGLVATVHALGPRPRAKARRVEEAEKRARILREAERFYTAQAEELASPARDPDKPLFPEGLRPAGAPIQPPTEPAASSQQQPPQPFQVRSLNQPTAPVEPTPSTPQPEPAEPTDPARQPARQPDWVTAALSAKPESSPKAIEPVGAPPSQPAPAFASAPADTAVGAPVEAPTSTPAPASLSAPTEPQVTAPAEPEPAPTVEPTPAPPAPPPQSAAATATPPSPPALSARPFPAASGVIPKASEPPPQAASQPTASPAVANGSAATPQAADGPTEFGEIRKAIAENRLSDADKLLTDTRKRLNETGDAKPVELAKLTGLAGDHAAADGRLGSAKWLWRLALQRFAAAGAIDDPAAREVSERMRLADQ